MSAGLAVSMEPLIRRKIFTTEEQAIRELLRDYTLRQIAMLQREAARFERKYGMRFERFGEYLHERRSCLKPASFFPNSVRPWGGPSCKKKMTG